MILRKGEDMVKDVKSDQIYQIKITLKNSQPPIWRRIQVRSNITLNMLHKILQVVMPWEDYHLHQFIINETLFDIPEDGYDGFMKTEDERKYKLNQIIPGKKFRFIYEYDFGDSWEHILLVEKILPAEEKVYYPRCITGERACPPEDIGGIFGYYRFLEILKDPDHPEYEEMKDWVGEDFDPEKFDIEKVNRKLHKIK